MTSWKSKPWKKAASWNYSSGDESVGNPTNRTTPAKTSDEALWRAVKRLSATWRWLKVDLTLLAEADRFENITGSMESLLLAFAEALVPELGNQPLSADRMSRPEVIELAGILGSLPADKMNVRPVHKPTVVDDKQVHKHCQTSNSTGICKKVQTNGEYMVRLNTEGLCGEWRPLTTSAVKRGSIIRCTSSAWTQTEGRYNLSFEEDQYCKILSQDDEGDIRIVALSNLGTSMLWDATEPRWLLERFYKNFEIFVPRCAFSDEASFTRRKRETQPPEDVT